MLCCGRVLSRVLRFLSWGMWSRWRAGNIDERAKGDLGSLNFLMGDA